MIYPICIAILIAAIVLFFALARGHFIQFGDAQRLLRLIAALPLLISGVALHFLHASSAAAMIPPVFPAPRFLVLFTGVLEILGATGLFVLAARRSTALWVAILMVAIFPANIYAAGQNIAGLQMPSVPVRLTMQVIYIWLVLLAGYGLPARSKRITP